MSWQRFAPKEYTNAELKLHEALGKARISFFSQYYVEGFKCDFVIRNLIVEVDGKSHTIESRRKKDVWKDGVLEERGYRVLRFTDDQINGNVDGCVSEIAQALEAKR